MRYLFILIHLFLTGLIAHVCVTGIYIPFKGRALPVASPAVSAPSPDGATKARQAELPPDGSGIVQRDLFRTGAPAPSRPVPAKTALAPKPTRLKLVLIGTVAGPQGLRMAVIQPAKGRPAKAHREGDTVGPARIRTILREKVILEVEGRREILSMVTKTGPGGPALPTAPVPAPQKSAAPPAPKPGKSFQQEVIVDWAGLSTCLAETPDVKELIHLTPHLVKGETRGYRIKGFGGKSALGDLLKLRTGDILVSMNGQPLGSPTDEDIFLSIFTQIDKDLSASIGIIRSGTSGTLHYAIR